MAVLESAQGSSAVLALVVDACSHNNQGAVLLSGLKEKQSVEQRGFS